MNFEQAFELLDLIAKKSEIEAEDVEVLCLLSQHEDAEIRSYAAELLGFSSTGKAEKALLCLCNDEDEIVRVNACDSLCAYATIDAYTQLIKNAANDKSALVKSYALLSIVDIMNRIDVNKKKLKELLYTHVNAKELGVYAAAYKGLYVLGEQQYLRKLLDLMESKNYQDRCAILNILEDIIDESNKEYVLTAIREQCKKETSGAVKSTIERIIHNTM